jgi:sensor histidine kinase YesM
MITSRNYLPHIKRVTVSLFLVGIIFVAFHLTLSLLINPLNWAFSSLTYLGFILMFVSATFFVLYLLRIQKVVVYISAIWIGSGIFVFVLNQFASMNAFLKLVDPKAELLLKFFDPLFAILFFAIGMALLMIEIVRYLYLTPPKKISA